MLGRTTRFVLVLAGAALVSVASAQDAVRAEAELRQLRAEIERIRGQVAKDAAERDRLTRALRTAETAANKARGELDRLRGERQSREQRRNELARQKADRERDLGRERAELAAQLRAAYLIGREEPLKLFLNQQDPARAGRMFAYYGYFGRARAGQLAAIEGRVREIDVLDADLGNEQQRIQRLEQAQKSEVSRLEKARSERGDVLATLTAESKARSASLQRLQREQAALEKLLRELRRAGQKFPTDSRSPFAGMRGKLAWPTTGKLVARFGERRAGSVKWDGVLIAADRGTPVRAVYRGRVVYADWLAGLGLLLIIDHGGGYLSLYGHNEQLFRAVGDQVAPGDTIAGVGDSGGRAQPELYFEIRQAARPLDPAPWFKDRQP
ncbi:MAG: peptidoglycan DD-metalloendopeptidase family protein [Gammaproteobacteria bacterium]|nr:peptidoglycan DD-metalloendopeptidase family protein [Gammaproteobacteria bacterium]